VTNVGSVLLSSVEFQLLYIVILYEKKPVPAKTVLYLLLMNQPEEFHILLGYFEELFPQFLFSSNLLLVVCSGSLLVSLFL